MKVLLFLSTSNVSYSNSSKRRETRVIAVTAASCYELFRVYCRRLLISCACFVNRYGGHQFGEWSSQLGDGRAHLLGEYTDANGRRSELQLKGSGRTPYSRHGDGRAVLRSSVREFLCSEAMHFLGVPTSRAVSLVTSDDLVLRDPLYDGHVVGEKASVVLRLAPSWFRIGSLEILTENGEHDLLRRLTDFIIGHHFRATIGLDDPDRLVRFFSLVQNRTVDLMVEWMSLGFAHGVCNTDNFSLLSITIDYGPFGFVDAYDPHFVPNLSDDTGMYALDRQPGVAYFNMRKLYQALRPILTETQRADVKRALKSFNDLYQASLLRSFRRKLGLDGQHPDDSMLLASLLYLMEETRADFTMTFRQLADISLEEMRQSSVPSSLWALKELSGHRLFKKWMTAYYDRTVSGNRTLDDCERRQRMNRVNPRYVLRTWMAESAIRKAEQGDYSEIWRIHMVLQRPYEDQAVAEYSGYGSKPPAWSRALKVSCSS